MNSESFVQCLTLTVACVLSSYAPLRGSGCVFSILWLRRPSRGACAASIQENSPNILPRSRKREPDCAVNCSRLFSSSLGVQNWAASTSEAEWRGSCPCALQWHPGPHSFSQCLTVFGRQMHPHRGVAAPSLHPQSQHVGPHNSPNKRERRVGPSCASCGAWTFEVRWENILAHLNYIKERATVEDRRVFEQMCCCYFLSACSCGLSGAGEVWWSCWLFQPVNLLQLWMRCSEKGEFEATNSGNKIVLAVKYVPARFSSVHLR